MGLGGLSQPPLPTPRWSCLFPSWTLGGLFLRQGSGNQPQEPHWRILQCQKALPQTLGQHFGRRAAGSVAHGGLRVGRVLNHPIPLACPEPDLCPLLLCVCVCMYVCICVSMCGHTYACPRWPEEYVCWRSGCVSLILSHCSLELWEDWLGTHQISAKAGAGLGDLHDGSEGPEAYRSEAS